MDNMEDNATDGSQPSKRRRSKKAVNLNVVVKEEVPQPKYKTFSDNSVHWQESAESTIDKMSADEYEYMVVGPTPPEENAPNMYDSFDESEIDLSVLFSLDAVRQILMEQARQNSVQSSLLAEIESPTFTPEAAFTTFEFRSQAEKNICFLWAVFNRRVDLLDSLLRAGADLHYQDTDGISAIHLSSFLDCIACTEFLISKGADVNEQSKCFSPLHCAAIGNNPETAKLLIKNGALVSLTTKKPHCEENVLHCSVRTNAKECVNLFIAEGMDVNLVEPSGLNPIHLAADLGIIECLEVMLDCPGANVNCRTINKEKDSTALHFAAHDGNVECVELLLRKGADVKLKNYRGFTALHLAARSSSLECVELLLKNGNANPNAEDNDKRTPLHAAIAKSQNSFDIIETLISWGANVDPKDEYGFTPLYLASLNGLSSCVETLIFHGADVTNKSKEGISVLNVIVRKTPTSMAMITQKLDSAITLHHFQNYDNREVELKFDFRYILQHSYPREINFLNTFVDEGQKEILLHPLCSAFLHIKWEKIRKYYVARLLFCLIFVLLLSLYVLTSLAQNCENQRQSKKQLCQDDSILGNLLRTNPFTLEIQWWFLVIIMVFELCRKMYSGIAGFSTTRQYMTRPENLLEWFVIVTVFILLYFNTNYRWRHHVGAYAVLAGWSNLMLMIGNLPVFGLYVAMYQKVQKEFAKLLVAYSCILIGFTITFCIIFPNKREFANPFIGFITVLTMTVGQLDEDLILNDNDGANPPFILEVSAQITYVMFIMFVTIILMNLLVGIAVQDIEGLAKTAGLSKLVRQTKLISSIESTLFNARLPKFLWRMVRWSALVSPQAYRVVLNVRPLNRAEKRLPRDIMMAAYNIAKSNKHSGHTISSKGSSVTANSFKTFYSNPTGVSEFSFNSGISALQMKLDERNARIDYLTNDLQDMHKLLMDWQVLLEKNQSIR